MPGAASEPDAVLAAADARSLAAIVYGGQDLDAAVACGEVRASGDGEVARRFLSLFSLPQPVVTD